MPWQIAEDEKQWNAFVKTHGPRSGAFLSSWEWGNFQKALGKAVYRKWFEESEKRQAAALCMRNPLFLGWSAWYCPRGPISVAGYSQDFFDSLRERFYGALFLRVEPPCEDDAGLAALSAGSGSMLRRSLEIQPSHTLLLSLEQTEESLCSAMHPKTRYNIHVAERKGVKIETYSAAHDQGGRLSQAFEEAWPLFKETGSRGGFHLHAKAYYEHMLVALQGDCEAKLWVARFAGEIIAALISLDFGKTRTYLHGASGNQHRNVMAPFLLQWSAIRDAKAKGFVWYDWWGVAPEDADESHPWAGITRFKTGFGGLRVNYPGTFDVVENLWGYRLYQIFRAIRRMR